MDLFDRLTRNGPFFKLIGGANFVDLDALTDVVAVYTAAGAHMVDVAATVGAVQAARRGIAIGRALGSARSEPLPLIMVSVTTSDDPHGQVARKVDDRCTTVCPFCLDACPHNAIGASEPFPILVERCCGCDLCIRACPHEALELVANPLGDPLEACWEAGARALELHTGSGEPVAISAWESACRAWIARGGVLSVSVNGVQLRLERAVAIARQVASWHPEGRVIVQTDGKPISGHAGEASTRSAVEMAAAFLDQVPGAAIQAAGGANDLTGPLARREGVPLSGIGIGSFARCLLPASGVRLGTDEAAWQEARFRASRLVATVVGVEEDHASSIPERTG